MTATSDLPSVELTWSTEQRNPRTEQLDVLDARGVVDLILSEDEVVLPAVQAQSAHLARAVELAVDALRKGGRIHYVGSGTSGRLGVLDAVELLPTYRVGDDVVVGHIAGGLEALVRAQEGAEDDAAAGAAVVADAGPHDFVIGIAASGRTPYVRGALESARARGLLTGLVSSNPQAPLAELADVAVLVDTGPEVVTGSTRMKAATAQKLVLNTFSTAVMVRMGKTYSNLMIDLVPTNEKLRRRVVRILEEAAGCDPETAQRTLADADGNVKTALVALLAQVPVEAARAAVAEAGQDPADPAGVRSAVARLKAPSGAPA